MGDRGEKLDELTTSRGEFRIRTLSFSNIQRETSKDEPMGNEILDELTTSRGEFRIRTFSFNNPQV